MSVHAILTEGEFSLRESITFACKLAKKLDTYLIGVTAMPDPSHAVLMTGVNMNGMVVTSGAELIKAIGEAQSEAREKLEALFNEVCDAQSIPAAKRQIAHKVGLPSDVYPDLAMLSDAFITPHECVRMGNDHGLAFESLLLDKRLPVIACGTDGSISTDTVIIAWDGSAEAARAVRFHMALLKTASKIIIAQNSNRIDVNDRNGCEKPESLQAYLAEHGLTASIVQFDGKVADGLLKLAADENAGIMIAGAYGHSRIEEFIFGGVSRNLLRAEHGPALALAH